MKSLIIKNNLNNIGNVKQWTVFPNNNIFSLVNAIPSPIGAGDDGATSGIVSGIPTPWARAIIFKYALQNNDGADDGLKAFYEKLKVEWRALIAFIALHGENLMVEKVELGSETNSLFKQRLGEMLFEEEEYWKDPAVGGNPFIQLIKYKVEQNDYVTVGATSPYTVVFSPPKVLKNLTVGKLLRNGSWLDPLTLNTINNTEAQKIYDTVRYMEDNLDNFKNNLGLISSPLDTALDNYKSYLKRRWPAIKTTNLFNAPANFFKAPFDTLFNAEAKLYINGNKFYINQPDGNINAFKVEDFLAPSSHAVEIIIDDPKKSTAYLLKVTEPRNGRNRYFALPFSDIGVIFFQNQLDDVLGNGVMHKLRGELINTNGGYNLKVFLTITYYTDIDGNNTDTTTIERTYILESKTTFKDERIIVWPDFIADNWKKYYLYSDLPHAIGNKAVNKEVKAFPLLGNINNGNINLKEQANSLQYIRPNNGNSTSTNIPECDYIVKALEEKDDYEIYESKLPFLGVELRYGDNNPKNAGYLITKNVKTSSVDGEMKLSLKNPIAVKDAIVGIDFGSNNSVVSYFSVQQNSRQLVNIRNRRRFFMGSERSTSRNQVANGVELLFFNKTEINGQTKSMLVTHDLNRLATLNGNSWHVRGGFPVSEKNLPIDPNQQNAIDSKFELNVNNKVVEVIHNMKWTNDPLFNNYTYSFLKTLWLQTNAELFFLDHNPVKLRWAYPAAMSNGMVTNYNIMWNSVIALQPINGMAVDATPLTEGVAVATYAIISQGADNGPGGGLSIGPKTLGIGYDVGGSTTDILLLIENGGQTVLAKQSSILLAAQYLTKAIGKYKGVREQISRFLSNYNIDIHGIEGITQNSILAPYFLNAVFDRLSSQELKKLYGELYTANQKELFGIIAFVSGLITYYTGQLAARVIIDQNLDIDFVTKGIYGKGGNIFNWITDVFPKAKDFYQNCFFAGLGKTGELQNEIDSLEENKRSKGLSNDFENRLKQLKSINNVSINQNVQYKTNPKDNKNEVSYGLASKQTVAGVNVNNIVPEIIGEVGYTFQNNELDFTNEIGSEHLESFGADFKYPRRFKKLEEFTEIYCQFVDEYQINNNTEKIRSAVKNLSQQHFNSYVRSLPQFTNAMNNNAKFDFKSPMIILEGMCLLDCVILD